MRSQATAISGIVCSLIVGVSPKPQSIYGIDRLRLYLDGLIDISSLIGRIEHNTTWFEAPNATSTDCEQNLDTYPG